MGLYASNIQVRLHSGLNDHDRKLGSLCEAFLNSLDDFEKTDELSSADYFISISPARSTGWLSIVDSTTAAYDLDGAINFAKYISQAINSTVVINFVFDSDDAISIIIDDGKVVKALSNKKTNVKKIKVDKLPLKAGEPYDDIDAIWKKREPLKEKFVERTASFFRDESRFWLIKEPEQSSSVIGYKLKNYLAKYAESSSNPCIVWAGSGIPRLDETTSVPLKETFSNIGRRFTGVAIRILDTADPLNIINIEASTIKDFSPGRFVTPSKINKTETYIELEFEALEVSGGVYEFAAKNAAFKYPSEFAVDYQQWGVVLDKNQNPIGRTQITGKKYDFSANLSLAKPSKTLSIVIFPLRSDPSKALTYIIGKPVPSTHKTTGEIMQEITDGKLPASADSR